MKVNSVIPVQLLIKLNYLTDNDFNCFMGYSSNKKTTKMFSSY